MSAPKVGFKIKLTIENKRGFEDPHIIVDAMIACWDDLAGSVKTLDASGKTAVI